MNNHVNNDIPGSLSNYLTPKILLVDDEEDFLFLSKHFLGKFAPNWNIITTESAEHALFLISTNSVSVIISDYNMPKMNGLNLLKDIRLKKMTIPFIMFSGVFDREVIKQIKELDGIYFKKQSSTNRLQFFELIVKIRDLLDPVTGRK
ncbi:MAG: response regulator transcription factor [Candidatus Hodarchaeales archaeon]